MTAIEKELLAQIGEELVDLTRFNLTVAAVSLDSSRNNLAASRLAESFDYILLDDGGIEIIANAYWGAIEYGLPVGTAVPIAALMEWAKRYRIKPKKGSFEGMLFAIQRTIIRRGTRPRPFVEQTILDADKQIGAYIDRYVDLSISLS